MVSPNKEPPIILPIVTGNRFFNNISLIFIELSNRYPNDRYDILATLCSNDKATNVNIGKNITITFSVMLLAFDDRNTARHTKKLQRIPKIIAEVIFNDIFVLVILINEVEIISFNGVFIINSEINNEPNRFPKYTSNQFFNNCLHFISLFNNGITNNELPVNNSVFINITKIKPTGNTNADSIFAIL